MMTRLSLPLHQIKPEYTVVVVGSGYGGSITASRLARAGQSVCLLERGKEFQPGEYPSDAIAAAKNMQIDLPEEHIGSATALYDFRVNPDVHVFVGCGLGGTSLVNANVCLEPELRVMQDPAWPAAIREDSDGLLKTGFARAKHMLRATPLPADAPPLKKLAVHEASSRELLTPKTTGSFYRPPIAVNFDVDGPNHAGVMQKPCNHCGDCVSGCNHHAKNTVLMNYLPDARNFGAEIFCECSVRQVERAPDGWWIVRFAALDKGREKFGAPELSVRARIVILAAGTLGSNEILLRSRAAGLPTSAKLGKGFTGNGDVLAFGYNLDHAVNGVGFGNHAPKGREPVGPCITSIIDLREQPDLKTGMVIEEGSMPGPLAALAPPAMAAAAKLIGKDTDRGLMDRLREKARQWISCLRGAYHGAMRNTQTYLVMSHDADAGECVLDQDRLRIRWPDAGEEPLLKGIHKKLRAATRANGGTFVKNPLWTKAFDHELITVHPLGGCALADDAAQGVLNERGLVFSGETGSAVHDGLYVADGSVMPRSLGVNPLITISALAERCAALIAKDHGWTIDYDAPSKPPAAAAAKTGIQFTETMRGELTLDRDGKSTPFEFTLTITADDLDALIARNDHPGRIVGTVNAPALSPRPLTATDGRFGLFKRDPENVNTRLMTYDMKLEADDGRSFNFSGFKRVHDDPGFDLWADTTTLFITVREGAAENGPQLGKGVLRILVKDFAKQLTTMQALNAPSLTAKLAATARFGQFFAGSLFDTFGGIFARDSVFDPDAPPRQKRPLRAPVPEIHAVHTADAVTLRLTRYQGGSKGPVMLVHGLGVSSLIFSIDTIETNLLEHLCAAGYDVWLLDFRASIALPASQSQFTGDDIAKHDFPAAVEKIRAITGAAEVQAVVHCYGSSTFFMSMLSGLKGIRSIVSSQIAVHCTGGIMTKLKTGLRFPELLDKMGIHSLDAYTDRKAGWLDRLYNQALRLYPAPLDEYAASPVDRRIKFMYGVLYELDQLNTATLDAMHEMFGIACMDSFKHIARIARAGHLVAADGAEIYLPHLDRLALPITFIHGEKNDTFLPVSTQHTLEALTAANDPDGSKGLYKRHEIPGYGHIDCIFGKNAVHDVFPHILTHLEANA